MTSARWHTSGVWVPLLALQTQIAAAMTRAVRPEPLTAVVKRREFVSRAQISRSDPCCVQTSIEDKEAGHVVSAINCYFICQVEPGNVIDFRVFDITRAHARVLNCMSDTQALANSPLMFT